MTTALRLTALALLLTSCAPNGRADRAALDPNDHAIKTTIYERSGEAVERFAIDDGTTCYRYFSTGSNAWSCVRDVPR